jgi:hypothetical protein
MDVRTLLDGEPLEVAEALERASFPPSAAPVDGSAPSEG